MRQGILVGGNWIIDQVKIIDTFPEEEKLVNIYSECSSNGGSAYNVLKDLVKLHANFPLYGLGLVGDDERGDFIIKECMELGIDTCQIKKVPSAYTSYTDVMTVKSTGKRTFFHQRGANALLDVGHFDFSGSNAKVFHLGYLLLLDKLDVMESNGMTGAARVLKSASEAGLMTSVDIVSESSDRFRQLIPPALPYVDYLFVNEYEAWMITGVKTTDGKEIDVLKCHKAATELLKLGVRHWVIIHFPAGVLAVHKDGKKVFQPSVNVKDDLIAGAVGAGDAFAAGVLNGLHNDEPIETCLMLGVCAAASSLFASTSSDGVLSAAECLELLKKYGYREEFSFNG